MRLHQYYVYILTNERHTVHYIGVSNDIARRCFEHRNGGVSSFTRRYNVTKLVYFEMFDQIDSAIGREKQLKKFSRAKKEALINNFNSEWQELYNNGIVNFPE